MHHNIIRPMNRREVLAIVRGLDAADGRPVSFRRFRRETGIEAETIHELFGTWRRLRQVVSGPRITRRQRRRMTNQQIVEKLRLQIRKSGERVTEADFCKVAGVTIYQIHARFGSWRHLRESAGASPRVSPPKVYTDRELLDDLLRVYLLTGAWPSQTLHQFRGGRFDPGTFKSRFGSWKDVKYLFYLYWAAYFILRDGDWNEKKHKLTFHPGPHNKLEWPEDLLRRSPWMSPEGKVTLAQFTKEYMQSKRSSSPEQQLRPSTR